MFESHTTDGLTATAVISENEIRSVRADVWSSDEMQALNLVCSILSVTTAFKKSSWNGPRTAAVYNESIHYRHSKDGMGIMILCDPLMPDSFIDALVDTFISKEIFKAQQVFESTAPNLISIVKENFLLLASASSTKDILESFYLKAKVVGLCMTESYFTSPFGDNISPAIALADNSEKEFNNLLHATYKFRDFIYA